MTHHPLTQKRLPGYELLTAVITRNLPTVKTLLNADSSIIDFQGILGYTAILLAVNDKVEDHTKEEIVAFLLSKKPNLSLTSDKGERG